MKKQIKIIDKLSNSLMEKISGVLFSQAEIDNIIADYDANLLEIELNSYLSDNNIKNILKSINVISEII